MIIRNKTKGNIIARDYELADSFLSRARGLLFRKKPIPILFLFDRECIQPIHSFFVPFQFDALYLNREKEVVEMFPSVRPFSSITPKKRALYLLELPGGTIPRLNIEVGDRLEF